MSRRTGSPSARIQRNRILRNRTQCDRGHCKRARVVAGTSRSGRVRSRTASTNMQSRGFQYIYNLSSGFSSFAGLSGAAPYLEP